MQVDPIKPVLNAPGTKRLIPKCADPLSKFAFNFKLRRYSQVGDIAGGMSVPGRGLHSSTSQPNLSRF